MTLTYIYHSGFAIEGDDCSIIIDFFKDSESLRKGIVYDKFLKQNKRIYVLSTHSHTDHFNREILKWKDINSDIRYVFSKDILDAGLADADDAVYLDKLDVYSDEFVNIRAFGSTDIGGSFLIKSGGKVIFHAGDLNNWHWDEESTAEEVAEAESKYLKELNLLAHEVQYLDLGMFPIDPRLGQNYTKGAQQFIDKIKVALFAPMHFGKEYQKAEAFESYVKSKGDNFFAIKEKGDSISF